MKKDLEQLFSKAKQISMTAEEKSFILNKIIGQIKEEPVRNSSPWRLYKSGGVVTLVSSYSRVSLLRYSTTLMSFVFMIALLGTTGVYAQISLPGEMLYPIKIHVNEKLEYLVALTPKARALLDATFAVRRLEEATTLLAENKLTKSNSRELATMFLVSEGQLVVHLSELRKNGADEDANKINLLFETSVQSHQEILDVIKAGSSTDEKLFREEAGTSAKDESPSNKKEITGGIYDPSAPFVTTTNTLEKINGSAVNTKATNTVEVPQELYNSIPAKIESKTLKRDGRGLKKIPNTPFE